MLAIITFISTIVIGFTPYSQDYSNTAVDYSGNTAEKIETVNVWQYENDKGWVYQLPEINILAGGKSKTVEAEDWVFDSEHGWMYEPSSIDVSAVNS